MEPCFGRINPVFERFDRPKKTAFAKPRGRRDRPRAPVRRFHSPWQPVRPALKPDYFLVATARFRPGTTVRQISHTVPSQPNAEQCSRP